MQVAQGWLQFSDLGATLHSWILLSEVRVENFAFPQNKIWIVEIFTLPAFI